MKTMQEKIRKANENFDLTALEVRKVFSAAKKRNRGKMIQFEGWFAGKTDEWGYRKVECQLSDGLSGERLDDVIIHCCLFDRRHSFVS